MIAIIDYQAGNLSSVATALAYLRHDCRIVSDPAAVAAAERVIFPGVGAAGEAMRTLESSGMAQAIHRAVADGKPFLGICLGFQILFEHSEENHCPCLGVLDGKVVRFADDLTDADSERPLKIPHMGWNNAAFIGQHPVWAGIAPDSEFYFVHSYYCRAAAGLTACTTDYGIEFTSGAVRDNVVAFQFHPEKSGRPGLQLLDNFCRWQP